MRTRLIGLVMFLGCGMLISGCAKKDLVKQEEIVPPAVTAPQPPAAPTAPQPVTVKEEAVSQAPIKEAPAAPTATEVAAPAQEMLLNRVYFDFDAYVLTKPARDTLTQNAQMLLKNSGEKVQIEGHCDERGSDEYNLALGENRAKAAMNYLITLGVPAERLSIISYGKERPLDPGHDEAAWSKNRRAEFVIIAK